MKKLLALLAIVATVSLTGCGSIETGNVGVRTDFSGNVEQTPLLTGFYTKITSKVDEYSAKNIQVDLKDLRPKVADNLLLDDMDVTVFYSVTPEKIPALAVKYASQNIYDKELGLHLPAYNLVETIANTVAYNEAAKYDSMAINAQRNTMEVDMLRDIQKELDKTDPGAFHIERVAVRKLLTDKTIEKSIQAAVSAKKNEEAAQAQARITLTNARAQADANLAIAKSITPMLIADKQAEAMIKLAGQGTHTVIFGGSGNSLVNIK